LPSTPTVSPQISLGLTFTECNDDRIQKLYQWPQQERHMKTPCASQKINLAYANRRRSVSDVTQLSVPQSSLPCRSNCWFELQHVTSIASTNIIQHDSSPIKQCITHTSCSLTKPYTTSRSKLQSSCSKNNHILMRSKGITCQGLYALGNERLADKRHKAVHEVHGDRDSWYTLAQAA